MDIFLYEVMKEITERICFNKEFLTDLDRVIGDGDHGINMARGFSAVMTKLNKDEPMAISESLKKIGMTLLGTVGGASGPLYGSAFLKAAIATKDIEHQDEKILLNGLEAALNGIKERGKATIGEKTMVDALQPAVEVLKSAIEAGVHMVTALERACIAAEEGVNYTKGIVATKGRASYLGERSLGHQDPGATSVLVILQAITAVAKNYYSD